MPRLTRTRGFSLIELAIVLVVVGLLVGAVVIGQSMIKAAQIRASLGEVDKYTRAVRLFQQKYNALPGDMVNATDYWSTNNGNGDGMIGKDTDAVQYDEWYRAWQQLSLAQFVEGTYTGVGNFTDAGGLLGTVIPTSSYTPGGYMISYHIVPMGAGTQENFEFGAGHVLEFGTVNSNCATGSTWMDCMTHGPLFSPVDAQEIDRKLDDGRPGTGFVSARPSTSTLNPGCSTTDNAATAEYTAENAARCALIIRLGY